MSHLMGNTLEKHLKISENTLFHKAIKILLEQTKITNKRLNVPKQTKSK